MHSTAPNESSPLVSDAHVLPRDVFTQVLEHLATRKHEAFATFECVDNPKLWFQVSGASLATGNGPWPTAPEPIEDTMHRLGVPVPAGFAVVTDDKYDTRVITFECEPMTPEAWAEFIRAFFTQVHNVVASYRVKGWVERAD